MNLEKEEAQIAEQIKVLIKRKKLVLGVIGFSFLISLGLVFLLPPRYLVSSLLEVGTVGREPVEPVGQTIEKIEAGVYGPARNLKMSNPEDIRLIKIQLVSSDSQQAVQTIEGLNQNIVSEHSRIIESRRKLLEDEIKDLEQRVKLLSFKGQETASLELRISELEKEKNLIQPTKVLSEPSPSKSLSTQPVLIVLAFVFLGTLFGLALAFWLEWWQGVKLWF